MKMNFKLNFTILVVATAGLLATAGDVTMTWASPMHSKLYSNDTSVNPLEESITSSQDALIGSLVTIGAMVGPYPFTFIADKFGRKIALLCVGVPHLFSYLSFAFAKSVYIFYFGRLFGGFAVGAGYALLPMYIAEISEDANRGFYSSLLMTFFSLGDMLPFLIGPFLSVMVFNLILACLPLTFLVIFLFFGVETPYYLLSKNNVSKAKETLMYLRSSGKKEVEEELNHIKQNLKREEGGHLLDIIKNPALRKALLISVSLIALQQLSGATALGFYLQPIFEASGSTVSSDTSSLIYGVAIFFGGFIAPVTVKNFNRKTMMVFSCSGFAVALSVMGAYFYLHDSTDISTDSLYWLPLTGLISGLFFFNSGDSILPWIIAAELFPNSCKQISSSVVSSTCWIMAFLVTEFFNTMVDAMTNAGVFWFFGGWCLFTTVITILFVPETKDKSFRDIQDILGS